MIRILSFILISSISLIFQISSQPWHYSLGSSTGSFTSGASIVFMPAAPNGTARVRIGSGGGSFNLENQVIPFGNSVYLRASAPTSASANKFSVFDFTPGKCFTLRFTIRMGSATGSNTGASSGTWYFFAGDGSCFSDNTTFNGAQCFMGFQMAFGTSGTITTSYRNGGIWESTAFSGIPFAQGIDYTVDIYGNNSVSPENYSYNDTIRILFPDKWDLWVNSIKLGDELPKAGLGNDSVIDSWMFLGLSSASNAANIFLDDIFYTNNISSSVMPVNLSSFSANTSGRSSYLFWRTSSEINNAGFEIERLYSSSINNGITSWQKAGFIHGNATTNEPKSYYFEDKNLSSGKYQYRLKQIDFNGNFEYYNLNSEVNIEKPGTFNLSQNYPNPSNPKCRIDYQFPFDGNVSLKVYNLTGQEVAELINENKSANFYTAEFDGTNLASGIYFYRITVEGNGQKYSRTLKMVLVK